MTYHTIKLIHLLALFVWVGGMIFSHLSLRKPMAMLPAEVRVPFARRVLLRFFNAVSVSAALVLLSGLWMIGRTARQMSRNGLPFEMPWSWAAMATLGIVMVVIFLHIRIVLYRRVAKAVKSSDWSAGVLALTSMHHWMTTNLGLGLFIIVIVVLG